MLKTSNRIEKGYESPEIKVTAIAVEGVLCTSNVDGDNEPYRPGGTIVFPD